MMDKDFMARNRLLIALLMLSVLFFLVKGVRYAIIESYVPIIFISIFIVLFIIAFKNGYKSLRRMLRVWGIFLLIWTGAVIFVEVAFTLTPSMTEAHIREQFNLLQNLYVALFLFTGIYLLKRAKHVGVAN